MVPGLEALRLGERAGRSLAESAAIGQRADPATGGEVVPKGVCGPEAAALCYVLDPEVGVFEEVLG